MLPPRTAEAQGASPARVIAIALAATIGTITIDASLRSIEG
jgi:hypothetical protein